MSSRYSAARYLGVGLISVYFATVLVAKVIYHDNEIFPFFNWSLFSESSNERYLVALGFNKINGKALPSTRLYYELSDIFSFARTRDIAVSKTVKRLSRAIVENDEPTIAAMRELLEERYMAEVKSADYSVLEITYDPIKRLRTGKAKQTVVLASFKKVAHD